jgi:hypothetical protein
VAYLLSPGGAGSQILMHYLSGSRERSKLHRERLESLVKAVYEYKNWVSEKCSRTVFRNEDHDSPSPLDEACMIQSLYFPALATEMLAVQKAFLPVLEFINAERIKHMKNREEFIAQYNPAPLQSALEAHMAAVSALLSKCRTLLPR